MNMRTFIVALLVAVFATVAVAPPAVQAATTQEEEILLKKKKKLAQEKLKKAEATKKVQARKSALARKQKEKEKILTASNSRKCTGFMGCLFGRGVRVERNRNLQNASFSGTTSVFAKKSRRTVAWTETKYSPGSIIVRTPERALYYVLDDGKAVRYAVGVGREGFQWSGNSTIVLKQEWPSWTPPKIMIEREAAKGHIIPPFMEGGPGNPLGARAMYIGGTIFRVHGTNNEASIGGAVSSGCIRMMNADVVDLYDRVKIGARIYVYQ
jgi:lipoprotein-anchoring transpeptidase ErfK/SrfK